MIEHYGNISHVYQDDINRKKTLQLLLLKYEIEEKKEKNINLNLCMSKNNIKYNNKYNKSQFLSGQIIDDDFLNKFKIIREVEEDKEYDSEEEEKNNKKESIIENKKDNLRIEIDENNINDIKIENGASKKETEKSNKKNNNQFVDDNYDEYINKNEIIKKILLEEIPKKYPEANKFLYKNEREYNFGDNIIKIELENNDLIFIINNEKYNLEEFEKFFLNNNNNKSINIKEKNKDEQINGIETTAVESDKSDNLIKEKNENEIEKNNTSQKEDDIEKNEDNYNSVRSQKRKKRKISIDEEDGNNQTYKESKKLKNGADSNEEFKEI